jgi:hypothetical protein
MHAFNMVGLVFLALAACCLRASIPTPRAGGDTGIAYADATGELARAVAAAETFIVYEGLPHPFEGKEFVEKEFLTKEAVSFDEERFYLPAQSVPAEDAVKLRRLFDTGLFKPWGGLKLCGGFHADYAISFESGGATYLVLICLGCHEARIIRESSAGQTQRAVKRFRLTTDLKDEGFKELQEILKKYRKQGPPRPDPKPRAQTPSKPPAPPPVPVRF